MCCFCSFVFYFANFPNSLERLIWIYIIYIWSLLIGEQVLVSSLFSFWQDLSGCRCVVNPGKDSRLSRVCPANSCHFRISHFCSGQVFNERSPEWTQWKWILRSKYEWDFTTVRKTRRLSVLCSLYLSGFCPHTQVGFFPTDHRHACPPMYWLEICL